MLPPLWGKKRRGVAHTYYDTLTVTEIPQKVWDIMSDHGLAVFFNPPGKTDMVVRGIA